jgi:hypothetical protein
MVVGEEAGASILSGQAAAGRELRNCAALGSYTLWGINKSGPPG